MDLNKWAFDWGIPYEAITDLQNRMTSVAVDNDATTKKYDEAAIQRIVRLEASKKGKILYRNNVGALFAPNGKLVRFGLANDSKAVNKNNKSSDLIGVEPILITAEHIGMIFGRLLVREVKRGDWVYTGTPEEKAQLNFMLIMISLGANACFCTGPGTL